ncbi:uncharacterized protein PITG_20908 [Phytophthora infestans T30-4]|uniref:Uncharacterized protein n=1 Tax=Phytophthora infestans (strain T30-4) TaxID=403677 RepID=D0P2L0_PHYIT|nr:uncharacterized protein PITG_20908 [Phytophthora infestans T30-4]EEY56669.1 conserved hypothetical protein [Phytophthora infestans T30-4]|eukprot:XP_002895462.1 conserved hypothetical protein [Phytophthora infestans T30-4]
MDRLHQDLATLPALAQLSASQLRDMPWRVKEMVFIVLFREQVSSSVVADELQIKSRDRKLERKADKLLDDVDRVVVRKKEESYRADFMQVTAAELARLGAPALITWQKLVFDKECCAQAFRHLLTRIKSSRRSAASGVSTNSSSLLAARYAASRQSTRCERDDNAQDDPGISIERTLPSKPSYFASKFKKNLMQILQEENAALTSENVKLREEIKQLEALNAVLQSDNSNNGMLDAHLDSVEFAQKRMRLLQAQNMQLQRQEEARAGAEQNTTEPEETGARQPVKWMLAVPDKLMNELTRVEAQIRGAATATNVCYESKLRVSDVSVSFLRSEDKSMKINALYTGAPLSIAHLRVDRVKQLESTLAAVSTQLDALSAQVLQHCPPKVSTIDPLRSSAYELGRSIRDLLLEVAAFGVVVPTSTRNAANDDGVTAGDIMTTLSSSARGLGGGKERERQAKTMLKQLHARYTAVENDMMAARREAEYWRAAWCTQDEILRRLAKRVHNLGQKKVEWCRRYLLAPMANLSEVFTSFQQVYDENTIWNIQCCKMHCNNGEIIQMMFK